MGNVIRLVPFAPSASLRRLARARHVEAVARLHVGDTEGFLSRLRDVDAIEDEARRSTRWEDGEATRMQMRDATVTGCDLIRERVRRRGALPTAAEIAEVMGIAVDADGDL